MNNNWKDLSDKYKKMVAGDDTQQVVYKSDDTDDCKPMIIEKITDNHYPYVVEEPVGMVKPKYVWNPVLPHWIDLAVESQSETLKSLTDQVSLLAKVQLDTLKLLSISNSTSSDKDGGKK